MPTVTDTSVTTRTIHLDETNANGSITVVMVEDTVTVTLYDNLDNFDVTFSAEGWALFEQKLRSASAYTG